MLNVVENLEHTFETCIFARSDEEVPNMSSHEFNFECSFFPRFYNCDVLSIRTKIRLEPF